MAARLATRPLILPQKPRIACRGGLALQCLRNPYKMLVSGRVLMSEDKAAQRAPCPECGGKGYVEASAKDDAARDGSEPRRRLFSGCLMRIS